ncbi:hybrid sensor histidine kinase/response regulator [Sediminibacterium sp.]|uniref:hybrid sensor histidine kinase/response regulator n=1 Tax=Sediminibacterium sp. TaxID=1917865 RepID=UPI003F71751E
MNKHILVVEDEKDIRDSLKTILELNDFIVDVAENGQVGLEKATANKPDLILCDVMMPVLDGFGLLEQLRSNGIETPLIFLTAKAQYNDLRTGMNLGADDYIFKPFKSAELLQSIERRLERKDQLEQHLKSLVNSLEQTIMLMVGHEFNTPMHGILSFTNLIKKKANDLANHEIEDFCNYLEKSSHRLQQTFSKIKVYYDLKLSGIAPMSDRTKFRVDLLIQNLATKIAGDYNRSSDLVFANIEASEINVSLELFSIALYELIDNAFKFSEKNAKVTIAVTNDSNRVSISILDQGTICKAAELRIQSGFIGQIKRSKFEQQGLGIGLALSLLIINSQNGQLYFEDIEPNGIRTEISLNQ